MFVLDYDELIEQKKDELRLAIRTIPRLERELVLLEHAKAAAAVRAARAVVPIQRRA